MRNHHSRPTLKEVAALSGVSEISVSRVMRNAPNVSPRLRAKVEAAAAALGYVPNRIAGALASRSTDLVAVIVPSMTNSVFPEVLDGIDAGLSDTRYRTVLGISHYDAQKEEDLLEELLAWNPKAVIVSGLEHSTRADALLRATAATVVEIMDVDGDPIQHAIGISHAEAGTLMARHFLERGRRRIGYVGAWNEKPSRSLKRREAFEAELRAHGVVLVARHIAPAPSSVVVGRDACAAMLRDHPDIDAIYFANDDLAVGALLHCLAKQIAVPERVALAGFNGIALLDAMPLRLTTIATPRYEMGLEAARLLQAADTATGKGRKIVLESRFVRGDTT